MSERPILFNDAMVRAILDGRKTQTRRPCRVDSAGNHPGACPHSKTGWAWQLSNLDCRCKSVACPFGNPGDTLWVREAWNDDWCDHVIYRADGGSAREAGYAREPRWRPSLHMPRSASRLTLRVTGVRVERVQDISEADAKAEGVEPWHIADLGPDGEPHDGPSRAYRMGFANEWHAIYAKQGLGWGANPWVWAVTFEVQP